MEAACGTVPFQRNLMATETVVPAVDRPTGWPTGGRDCGLADAVRAITNRRSVLEAELRPTGKRTEPEDRAGQRARFPQGCVERCPRFDL